MPVLAFDVAVTAQAHQWGVLRYLQLPTFAEFILCLLILDFVIYTQYHVFHKVPWLWRLHRMHHSDQDIDVTTVYSISSNRNNHFDVD